MCFDICEKKILEGEVNFKDGPLKRVMSILENAKCILPEDWVLGAPNAFDWDKKPVPPEVPDFENYAHDEGEESENDGKWASILQGF